MAVIDGTNGPETLNGTAAADTINGLGGNDTLNGVGGDDDLYAGAGTDSLNGGDGDDRLILLAGQVLGGALDGGAGEDRIVLTDVTFNGASGSATFTGIEHIGYGPGLDGGSLIGTAGADVLDLSSLSAANLDAHYLDIFAGGGSDHVTGGMENDTIDGGGGNDVLAGNGANDTLHGDDGDDILNGGDGDDDLIGGTGIDSLYGGNGDDILELNGVVGGAVDGGAGRDYLFFSAIFDGASGSADFAGVEDIGGRLTGTSGNDVLDLSGITGPAGSDSIIEIFAGGGGDGLTGGAEQDVVYGEGGEDRLTGNGGSDLLMGGDGIDSINGGAGFDFLDGGAGDDVINGGADGDTISGGAGLDVLNGGAGDDGFDITFQLVDDVIDGGAGIDSLFFQQALFDGNSGTARFVGIETLYEGGNLSGTAGDDVLDLSGLSAATIMGVGLFIAAGDGDDRITGGVENDEIDGGAGNDVLNGGGGDDRLYGGDEAMLFGGAGNDILEVAGLFVHGLFDGGTGDDTLNIGSGLPVRFDVGSANARFVSIEYVSDNVSFEGTTDGDVLDLGGLTAATLAGASFTIFADAGNDRVTGGAENDRIIGGDGDDILKGGGGSDYLEGNGGTDSLDGGAGDDELLLSGDQLLGGVIDGGAGDDILTIGGASFSGVVNAARFVNIEYVSAYLLGSDGDDLLDLASLSAATLAGSVVSVDAGGGGDLITGGVEDDRFNGGSGNDTLNGGSGNDELIGGAGDDMLAGGAGDDILISGVGTDLLSGGAGDDVLQLDGGVLRADSRIDGGLGRDDVQFAVNFDGNSIGAVFNGIEFASGYLGGTNGDDRLDLSTLTAPGAALTIEGAGGADIIGGSGGQDEIRGGEGDDILAGGAGDDQLLGGSGNDTASYVKATAAIDVNLTDGYADDGGYVDSLYDIENVTGSAFNDRLSGDDLDNVLEGGAGNDRLDGRGGTDTASYVAATTAVTASLAITAAQATRGAGSDTLTGIENLTGSVFADRLSGNAGANALNGGAGDDVLDGGAGNDRLDGGAGNDTASYAATATGVLISLNVTIAQNSVGAGSDALVGIENVTGSAFDDRLFGNDGANILIGGDGGDQLIGGAGSDRLFGGASHDVLQDDDDASDDLFDGGGGSDHYYLIDNGGRTTIVDAAEAGYANVIDLFYATAAWVIDAGAGTGIGTGASVTFTRGAIGWIAGTAFDDRMTAAAAGTRLEGQDGDDVLTGAAGSDLLNGGAGDDHVDGGVGDDVLAGGDGDDLIMGGAGIDTLDYRYAVGPAIVSLAITASQATIGAGIDTILQVENLIGTTDDDVLTGNAGANRIEGNIGVDLIEELGGNDVLIGGEELNDQDDALSYAHASARVVVSLALDGVAQDTIGAGIDTVSGFERLVGSAFNDVLTAGLDSYQLVGGAGKDMIVSAIVTSERGVVWLEGGDGDDIIHVRGTYSVDLQGGAGFDTAAFSTASAAVIIDLTSDYDVFDTGGAGVVGFISIEGLIGSRFDDVLVFGVGDNRLSGGDGNDLLAGGAGDDLLDGGAAIDTIDYGRASAGVTVNLISLSRQNTGGAGIDTIRGVENVAGSAYGDVLTGNDAGNALSAGAGDDVLTGGGGNDQIDGGTGIDTASYARAAAGVKLSLLVASAQNTQGAGVDTLVAIENLTGSALDDVLTGNASNNVLTGNAGNDLLIGGLGNDTLSGGAGIDTVSFASAATGVTISLLVTAAQNSVGAGIDTFASIENLVGSAQADTLTGNAQNNAITGGVGDDVIDGGSGADMLDGGNGNDVLKGAGGDDVLVGGAGRDMLTGGAGNDRFVYLATGNSPASTNADRILDFAAGDVLDLSAIDAIAGTVGTNEAFVRVASFSGVAGQLTLAFASGTGTTTLLGDTDGNGVADFSILFSGDVTALTGSWVL